MNRHYTGGKIDAQMLFEGAYKKLFSLPEVTKTINAEHCIDTASRASKALIEDLLGGLWEDPKECLQARFTETKYDEIIYVNDISFVSVCAHHGLCFFGKAYFGYLPGRCIVGISKIPRLVHCLSRRPQVQEKLTVEIIDTFNNVIEPKGCGIVMEAYHLCMSIRGVEEPAYTKTTALRGLFKSQETTKQEFLNGIQQTSRQIWP